MNKKPVPGPSLFLYVASLFLYIVKMRSVEEALAVGLTSGAMLSIKADVLNAAYGNACRANEEPAHTPAA